MVLVAVPFGLLIGLAVGMLGGGGSVLPFNGKPQPNVVTNNGNYGTIAGGYNNVIKGYGGAILGGSVNFAIGDFAAVGAGQFNTNFGDHAFIGGGINNDVGTVYLDATTVRDNIARGGPGSEGGLGDGGGIANYGGTIELDRSAVSGNSALGGAGETAHSFYTESRNFGAAA